MQKYTVSLVLALSLVLLVLVASARAEGTADELREESHEAQGDMTNTLVEDTSGGQDGFEVPGGHQGVEVASEVPNGVSASLMFAFHLYLVADVPVEYGVWVYSAAQEFGLHPYDLAATLISEESGPDYDFSIWSSAGYRSDFSYDPKTEGKASSGEKERGLFQVKPNWVYKAAKAMGEDWTKEDLYDPSVNIRVGAFVVRENMDSHASCGDEARKRGLSDSLHNWTAHYKCGSSHRDDLDGRCRTAQRKWDKIRASLVSVFPVDLKEVGRAHNERLRSVLASYTSRNKHLLRRRIRDLCEEYEIPVPKKLKKMSEQELREQLSWIEMATGETGEPIRDGQN